jgi:HAD superfamily hydrolase (TIGR01509 family)
MLDPFSALLFDLDGVLTRTAVVHSRAWATLFDAFLRDWSAQHGEPFVAFRTDDYQRFVDGRRRYDGVDTFLRARGIVLPWGAPTDPPDALTVCGLGNRKSRLFVEALERDGVDVFPDGVALLQAARAGGRRTAVVSASEHCRPILEGVGLQHDFDVMVTGVEAAALGLAGKPAPDTFIEAARALELAPGRCVVIEDAASGVRAGRAGGFGMVVGVDRGHARELLEEAGAHVVVGDLGSLLGPAVDAGGDDGDVEEAPKPGHQHGARAL